MKLLTPGTPPTGGWPVDVRPLGLVPTPNGVPTPCGLRVLVPNVVDPGVPPTVLPVVEDPIPIPGVPVPLFGVSPWGVVNPGAVVSPDGVVTPGSAAGNGVVP